MGDLIARAIAYQNGKKTGPFAYNTDIGLRRWRTALAKVKAGQQAIYNVSWVGDSISVGVGSSTALTDYITKGYVAKIRTAMNAKYGDVGRGFLPMHFPRYDDSSIWALSAGWTLATAGYGVGGYCRQSIINGETATISFSGTGIGIMYGEYITGGKLSVSIDGGAATVIDTLNPATGSDKSAKILEITGLANGVHTAVITSVITGSQRVYLLGAYEIKGTSGVRMNMCSLSGVSAYQSGTSLSIRAEIGVFAPVLTVISLTANDYNKQATLDSYTSFLQAMITAGLATGDVLLLSTGVQTDALAIPQTRYVEAMKTLAITNNCAYIDLFNRWGASGTYASTTLGFLYDNVHPNEYGHQDLATAVLNVLLETDS